MINLNRTINKVTISNYFKITGGVRMKRVLSLSLCLLLILSFPLLFIGCGGEPDSSMIQQAEYVCPNCAYTGVIDKWEKKSDTNYICPNCKLEVSLNVQDPAVSGNAEPDGSAGSSTADASGSDSSSKPVTKKPRRPASRMPVPPRACPPPM